MVTELVAGSAQGFAARGDLLPRWCPDCSLHKVLLKGRVVPSNNCSAEPEEETIETSDHRAIDDA